MQCQATQIHIFEANVKRSESPLVVYADSMEEEKRSSFSIANFIPEKSEFHFEIT
jgi:hypothetical protein